MRIFRVSQSASATVVAVTEPKSEPVGLDAVNQCSRLVGGAGLVTRLLGFATCELGDESRCRELGQAAWQQVVACVPTRDVDDLPAQAKAVDILTQHDLHG